ncbi:SET domain protein [Metarhizium album ARSEF 1941]|uniref:SET domain protein n=1 Tax=Metarhizium album (strain ARSEF 1941) TaxID=1081103 RepID=A0A0B2WYM0_METAS|nr:SET domain protein [Metarhizium album ARSEF 1941]KHN98674.1 SET domain protein [Metarhizium album ARSEF 1941]
MLRTLNNTPAPIRRALGGSTVHAVLAASLCLETDADFAVWRAVLPTEADMETCMPLSWPAELQRRLPPRARSLLDEQRARFDADWAPVAAAYPSVPKARFLYSWHLVNSRTFYHVTRATERLPPADHMVLQPVADLFNHAPDGCSVAFDDAAFTVTTTHAVRPGDELFIRYGPHSNDALLVEYGFTLPPAANPWDEIGLDEYLCPLFTAGRRAELEDAGFWGGYMLDAQTACYRTHTALRMLCCPRAHWRDVLDGRRDEDADRDAVDHVLRRVLRKCGEHVASELAELERCAAANDTAARSLRERWLQMGDLVTATLARLRRDATPAL